MRSGDGGWRYDLISPLCDERGREWIQRGEVEGEEEVNEWRTASATQHREEEEAQGSAATAAVERRDEWTEEIALAMGWM